MEDFNADKAKSIVESSEKDELHNILIDIRAEAEMGKTYYYVKKPLNRNTIEQLKERGFQVGTLPPLAVQKEGLYYKIHW